MNEQQINASNRAYFKALNKKLKKAMQPRDFGVGFDNRLHTPVPSKLGGDRGMPYPISMATLARLLNYGFYSKWYPYDEKPIFVPARPFMFQWIHTSSGKKSVKAYIHANIWDLKGEEVSKIMEQYIKLTVTTEQFIPNSPRALRHKQGTTPLINSGELMNSFVYKEIKR